MATDPQRDLEPLLHGTESPERFGALADAIGDRKREPGHLVVLGRHLELPKEKTIAAFAEAMDYDVYTARQRLLAPTPRVLRREVTAAESNQWAEWLSKIGLRAFALSEEDLAAQDFLTVKSLDFVGDDLALQTPDNESLLVPTNDIIAIAIGELSERTRTQVSSGGMLKVSNSGTHEESVRRTESVIDLHRRSANESIRIRQDDFEFSRLYPEATGASAVLIRTLAKSLARQCPGALIYDDFKQVAEILGTTRQLLSNSSYLERHWFSPGMKLRQERIVQESTAGTFDVYSTLARFEVLRCD